MVYTVKSGAVLADSWVTVGASRVGLNRQKAAARTAAGNEAFKNTVFVGFDATKSACDSMLNGQETMSVGYSSYGMAKKAIETMVKILDGQDVGEFVSVDSEIVTKENAQQRLETLKSYV